MVPDGQKKMDGPTDHAKTISLRLPRGDNKLTFRNGCVAATAALAAAAAVRT